MKVITFQVPEPERKAFRLQIDELPHFYDKLHQHPEVQVTLIERGEGVLIAGDYTGPFTAGDVYVLGSNLPHVFRSDAPYFKVDNELSVYGITLFFDEKYVGQQFWQLSEMQHLRAFVNKAKGGFRVNNPTQPLVSEYLRQISKHDGLAKLLMFFELLKTLTESHHLQPLSMGSVNVTYDEAEGKRMNSVLQFTFQEYHRLISIHEVAQLANLSPEAFCRYFKLRTRKTYLSFLNEVRISNACKLLIDRDLLISDVCYQVGFNNLSNFNRVFRKVMGNTPSAYTQTRK